MTKFFAKIALASIIGSTGIVPIPDYFLFCMASEIIGLLLDLQGHEEGRRISKSVSSPLHVVVSLDDAT